MRKKGLVLIACALAIIANAGVYRGQFKINFDKVVHIVLPNEVELATAGSEYIEAMIVEESPNIVRVVASEENFAGGTNLSIVDKGGEVYSYQISYSGDTTKLQSVFYPPVDNIPTDQSVIVNKTNKALALFPSEVVYLRAGNDFSIETKVTTAKNIVEISAIDEQFPETNFFVVDKNGKEYNILVDYGTNADYVFDFKGQNGHSAIVKDNQTTVADLAEKALASKAHLQQTGMTKNGMDFAIKNIFVNEEYIMLVLYIKNGSYIDYNIDVMKYFFVDKKKTKTVLQQENGQNPIELPDKYVPTIIKGKSSIEFPLFFKKFTIPDDKNFRIEIQEENGGRNLFFNLQNKDVKDAKPLK